MSRLLAVGSRLVVLALISRGAMAFAQARTAPPVGVPVTRRHACPETHGASLT
jgi:hypothetical protein